MSRSARKIIKPIDGTPDSLVASVFSDKRKIKAPSIKLARGLRFNSRLKMDGLKFLSKLHEETIPVAFFDPQYKGKAQDKARASLPQMREEVIAEFVRGISKSLIPSGHLFLWMDKFHLCTGFTKWLSGTPLDVVDMLTWNKGETGMSEHLVLLQKRPCRAKGVWKIHNIPDVWYENVKQNGHAHKKPIDLQGKLIESVSNADDIVIDPAAGSFSVMEACVMYGRNFLGCDING